MIPKIVHYCWFGNKNIPARDQKFINEWREFFPGYEIKIWSENNFDIRQCDFCKEAYEKEQYAFVSDYVRAKVLYEYGGIYLDTDVKLLRPLPEIEDKGIMGFERRRFLGTAVLASESHNSTIKELLEYYESHNFLNESGDMNIVANVSILTDIMVKKGLELGGEEQEVAGFHIYSREYFYPKKIDEEIFKITDETYAIHYCNNSWLTDKERRRGKNKIWIEFVRPILQRSKNVLTNIVGKDKARELEIKFRNKLR